MNRGHLSDDELIALLYGLGDTRGHLDGCSECSERWDGMLKALGKFRADNGSPAEISGRTLAAQRQQILERVERPFSGLPTRRWVPAVAVAGVLAMALFLSRPAGVPPPAPTVSAESDAELFTDVYSMERDVEPRAAAPIRGLFQEASFEPSEESRNR